MSDQSYCDDRLIRHAFEWHFRMYGQRKRAWDMAYHISMWRKAESAFQFGSLTDFAHIYEELRRRWQVFRGGSGRWTIEQTFDALNGCPAEFRSLRLRDLGMSHVPRLWDTLTKIASVKQTLTGPSTVAVSKFLHFWNPRLFVIVDDGVIWKRVLAHHWLIEPIRQVRETTDLAIFGQTREHADATCDLGTYVAVLTWAAGFAKAHPKLSSCFADYIQRCASGCSLPDTVAEYDAAAMEWFLLGVVEIPPTGWRLPAGLAME